MLQFDLLVPRERVCEGKIGLSYILDCARALVTEMGTLAWTRNKTSLVQAVSSTANPNLVQISAISSSNCRGLTQRDYVC
jgi:hypothetical protein